VGREEGEGDEEGSQHYAPGCWTIQQLKMALIAIKTKIDYMSNHERSGKALELCKHESTTSAVGPLETVVLYIGVKFGEGALFLAACVQRRPEKAA
jgi:hypothetical protein